MTSTQFYLLWTSLCYHAHCSISSTVAKLCPRECSCAGSVVASDCPDGIPSIRDGCGCCWLCARQAGESCSPRYPCDSSKGLHCTYQSKHFINSSNPLSISQWNSFSKVQLDPGVTGVCWKLRGRRCYINGTWLPHSAVHQNGCRFRCVCVDGSLICSDVCSNEDTFRPNDAICRTNNSEISELHRLPPSPGDCCPRWVCTRVDSRKRTTEVEHPISFTAPILNDNSTKYMTCDGVMPMSSPWSTCNKQCGLGVSFRWTRETPACKNVTQLRLCFWRPCQTVNLTNTEPFVPTLKFIRPAYLRFTALTSDANEPIPLAHSTQSGTADRFVVICQLERPIRPRFCNRPPSTDQCCLPKQVRTKQLRFQCTSGQSVQHYFEWIHTCHCLPWSCTMVFDRGNLTAR